MVSDLIISADVCRVASLTLSAASNASDDGVSGLRCAGLINSTGSSFHNYTHVPSYSRNNKLKQEDNCLERIVSEFHNFPSLLFVVPRSVDGYWKAEGDLFRCMFRTLR